jgi:hypothetical protein
MRKLLALIKTKGKSKEQIAEEVKAVLKRKGVINEDGKMKAVKEKSKNENREPEN